MMQLIKNDKTKYTENVVLIENTDSNNDTSMKLTPSNSKNDGSISDVEN